MKGQRLMTGGSIFKHLFFFAIPLVIGNLFQQLYNTADSIIVGNFVGSEALAAVGSSGPLINLLGGLFMGTATGAGVVISQYFGAKDRDNVGKAVHTTVAFALVSGISLTVVGMVFSSVILKWMGTPPEVMENSVIYLRTYFAGSLFSVGYNMCTGVLNAVGDSRKPLYFLAIASVVNIALDLLFVVVFHMGVIGAALATIISQAVSFALVLWTLTRVDGWHKVVLKKVKFYKGFLSKIVKIGLPTGIQNMVVSFSNVIVQSSINSFGSYAMAGCAAYNKIDGFNILPVQSISLAATTFAGQNFGAKKYDRVKKCLFVSVAMVVGYTAFSSTLLIIFGNNIIGIFSSDPNVLKYGMMMLMHMAPFYFMVGVDNVLAGNIRGVGKTMMSMIFFVANLCGVRVLWIGIMLPIFRDINIVFWGYPVSWLTCLICMVIYLFRVKWLKESF